MNEILKLAESIENYNDGELCLGTLRTLKKIKDISTRIATEVTQLEEQKVLLNKMIDTNDATIDQMRTIMEAAASVAGKNWLCVKIALSEYLSDGEGDHLDWLLSEYLKMKEQDKTVDG